MQDGADELGCPRPEGGQPQRGQIRAAVAALSPQIRAVAGLSAGTVQGGDRSG